MHAAEKYRQTVLQFLSSQFSYSSTMFRMNFLLLCVLLWATSCSADKGAARSRSVTIQPWLVGLSAVVGFLFIVFVILIIRRLLKKNRVDEEDGGYDRMIKMDKEDTQETVM
ncbi:small integral membrane protein 24 [Nothobranchius furzeri]|uniref:small integral membrane protein 24 n=1 Tax=Nothobranchius furzeri TaxID=105023 RepID=UPI0024047E4E|nr:small integral membrane protein 24-like [Nothobranchius furzeri]